MHFRVKSLPVIALACAYTGAVLILGYILLGVWPMLLFALGFVGGLLLWLLFSTAATFEQIKIPYFLTLVFFVLHKAEERRMDFFPALSRITGEPMPSTDSVFVFLLYAFAGAWLLIPPLVFRKFEFGYFLAWTFFASMGIIELAHFIFPLLTEGSYGYFPGMASAAVIVPSGWWGMWRLRPTQLH